MAAPLVDIHTHRPPEQGVITLRSAGIHPWEADGRSIAELLPLPEGTQAIGETGLDGVRGAPPGEQLRLLREQLDLAERLGLPVVLHCVRTFEPLMRELHGRPLRAILFHGFVGSPEQALRAAARGYSLSFGIRSFRSPRTLAALRVLPVGCIFCETDDDPAPIGEIYRLVARERGIGTEELAEALWHNYERFIGKESE